MVAEVLKAIKSKWKMSHKQLGYMIGPTTNYELNHSYEK